MPLQKWLYGVLLENLIYTDSVMENHIVAIFKLSKFFLFVCLSEYPLQCLLDRWNSFYFFFPICIVIKKRLKEHMATWALCQDISLVLLWRTVLVKFCASKWRNVEHLHKNLSRMLYIPYLWAIFDVVSLVKAEVAQVVGRWPLAGFSGFWRKGQVRKMLSEGA